MREDDPIPDRGDAGGVVDAEPFLHLIDSLVVARADVQLIQSCKRHVAPSTCSMQADAELAGFMGHRGQETRICRVNSFVRGYPGAGGKLGLPRVKR
jgi:hypothetical protein